MTRRWRRTVAVLSRAESVPGSNQPDSDAGRRGAGGRRHRRPPVATPPTFSALGDRRLRGPLRPRQPCNGPATAGGGPLTAARRPAAVRCDERSGRRAPPLGLLPRLRPRLEARRPSAAPPPGPPGPPGTPGRGLCRDAAIRSRLRDPSRRIAGRSDYSAVQCATGKLAFKCLGGARVVLSGRISRSEAETVANDARFGGRRKRRVRSCVRAVCACARR